MTERHVVPLGILSSLLAPFLPGHHKIVQALRKRLGLGSNAAKTVANGGIRMLVPNTTRGPE